MKVGQHSFETIFLSNTTSEEPPNRVRLASQASRDTQSQVSESQKQDFLLPIDHSNPVPSSKRPFGPRCPSPSPSRSPSRPEVNEMSSLAEDRSSEPPLPFTTQTPTTTPRREMETSPLPRSKRQPFVPAGNTETTPKPSSANNPPMNSVEPLSIKKKSSVRSSLPVTTSPARKSNTGQSPLSRSSVRVSPKRSSSQTKTSRSKPTTQVSAVVVNAERVLHLAQTTKEDVRFHLVIHIFAQIRL
jgi:protein ECT2